MRLTSIGFIVAAITPVGVLAAQADLYYDEYLTPSTRSTATQSYIPNYDGHTAGGNRTAASVYTYNVTSPVLASTVRNGISGSINDPAHPVLDAAIASLTYNFNVSGAAGATVPVAILAPFKLTQMPGTNTITTSEINLNILSGEDALLIKARLDEDTRPLVINGESVFFSQVHLEERSARFQWTGTAPLISLQSDFGTALLGSPITTSFINASIPSVTGLIGGLFFIELGVGGLGTGSIQMQASSFAGDNGTVRTFLDPYISIDPTYLLSSPGTSVTVEYGIGNAPIQSVPESSSFFLLLVGLTALFKGLTFNKSQPNLPK